MKYRLSTLSMAFGNAYLGSASGFRSGLVWSGLVRVRLGWSRILEFVYSLPLFLVTRSISIGSLRDTNGL